MSLLTGAFLFIKETPSLVGNYCVISCMNLIIEEILDFIEQKTLGWFEKRLPPTVVWLVGILILIICYFVFWQ